MTTLTPEQIIVLRMCAFGVGWWDDEDEVATIDTKPHLECWSTRDVLPDKRCERKT